MKMLKNAVEKVENASNDLQHAEFLNQYANKGADLSKFLAEQFDVESIYIIQGEDEAEKIRFPMSHSICKADISKIEGHRWIVISNGMLDSESQKQILEKDGSYVELIDLLTLFDLYEKNDFRTPLIANDLGNSYESIIVCGTGGMASQLYTYFRGFSQENEKTVLISPDELRAGDRKNLYRNKDVLFIVADLIPDIFCLEIGKERKDNYILWAKIGSNKGIMDERLDITEHIIPKLLEGGGTGLHRLCSTPVTCKKQVPDNGICLSV